MDGRGVLNGCWGVGEWLVTSRLAAIVGVTGVS